MTISKQSLYNQKTTPIPYQFSIIPTIKTPQQCDIISNLAQHTNMKNLLRTNEIIQEKYSDEKLYELIYQDNSAAITYLYKHYLPLVKAELGLQIHNKEELKDFFQEGVIALWQNIKNGNYTLRKDTKMSSYLIKIIKYRWFEKLKSAKQRYETNLPDHMDVQIQDKDTLEIMIQIEQNNQLIKEFEKLGEKCQIILKEYYFNKKRLSEIATMLGMQEASIKNEKYRCMLKLRSNIQIFKL